jgi:hypothetical protein
MVRRRNVTYWCSSTNYDLLYSARLFVTTAVVVVTEAGVSSFKPKQCIGNVGCAGVSRLMIFSGLWVLRALFPSGGGREMQDSCRNGVCQLQVSSRWLCCRWPPDDIQWCCLVVCRLSAAGLL